MLITREDFERFTELRKKYAQALETTNYIADDRPYPMMGAFEVTAVFPDFKHDQTGTGIPQEWDIDLLCYIDSTQERAIWCGRTFREALDKCELDVMRLIEMMDRDYPLEGEK